MSTYVRYPSSSATISEPLTLTQILTLAAAGITNPGPYISTVASGSQAIELVQGARMSFDSGTGAKYLASDGTNVVLTGLGLSVPGASGIGMPGTGSITGGGGSGFSLNGASLTAAGYTATQATAQFYGTTTQTTAASPGVRLKGYASNQANQQGVEIGVGTTWTGTNTQKLIKFGHSLDGTPVFPSYIMATGKHCFYNSASNAADVLGTATLVGGTVTVATTAIDAGDIIQITMNTPGGTLGNLSAPVASIVAGTSFVINSSSAIDTSTVNWILFKKA